MFKTYFKYGPMNSSKTANLLMAVHNYQTKGVKTYLITPKTDNRAGVGTIKARIGLQAKADFIIDKFDNSLKDFINQAYQQDAVLFMDECQFVNYDTVKQLINWCHELDQQSGKRENFNLLAYGLLTDFNNHLFSGTRAWLEEADSLHEIKTVCKYCNRKATCNYLDQTVAKQADSNIVVGDKAYQSVCSYHYYRLMHKNR